MSKSLTRTLYLIGIVIGIVAGVLEFLSLSGAHVDPATNVMVGVNPTLLLIGGALGAIAGIFGLIAWIGALVKTAQLGRWGWFVVILVFSGIAMLVYIFAGPETRPEQAQVG